MLIDLLFLEDLGGDEGRLETTLTSVFSLSVVAHSTLNAILFS